MKRGCTIYLNLALRALGRFGHYRQIKLTSEMDSAKLVIKVSLPHHYTSHYVFKTPLDERYRIFLVTITNGSEFTSVGHKDLKNIHNLLNPELDKVLRHRLIHEHKTSENIRNKKLNEFLEMVPYENDNGN